MISLATRGQRWWERDAAKEALAAWIVVLLTSGQGFRQLLTLWGYASLSLVSLLALLLVFRPSWRALRPPLLVGAFVALAVASVAWSATPVLSALAAVMLVGITLAAIVTVRGIPAGQFAVVLYRGFQSSLGLGVLFELFAALVVRGPITTLWGNRESLGDPAAHGVRVVWTQALMFEGGPLQGFVGNRNPFGAIALFAAILAGILLLDRRIRALDGLATLAVAALVHVLTVSATATVAALYLGGLWVCALVIRRLRGPAKRALSMTVVGATAVVAVLTLKFRNEIFGLVERGPDLSHRTRIWDAVIVSAQQRPEGWGYVGYWPVWSHPYSDILDRAGVYATHSHNAFLDAWLQMGLIGAALLLGVLILNFGAAWRLVERAGPGDTYVPLGWALLAAALSLQGLTESRILVEYGWFLIVALACSAPQVFTLAVVDPEFVHSARPSGWRSVRTARRRAAQAQRSGASHPAMRAREPRPRVRRGGLRPSARPAGGRRSRTTGR